MLAPATFATSAPLVKEPPLAMAIKPAPDKANKPKKDKVSYVHTSENNRDSLFRMWYKKYPWHRWIKRTLPGGKYPKY